MDKQKQIEEMAKETCGQQIYPCGEDRPFCFITHEVCNCCEDNQCDHYEICERIYNAGYRKIPEGAVVILDEEMEDFAEKLAQSPQMQKVMQGLIKSWQKETAEKFAESLKEKLKDNVSAENVDAFVDCKKYADEICDEITEENIE